MKASTHWFGWITVILLLHMGEQLLFGFAGTGDVKADHRRIRRLVRECGYSDSGVGHTRGGTRLHGDFLHPQGRPFTIRCFVRIGRDCGERGASLGRECCCAPLHARHGDGGALRCGGTVIPARFDQGAKNRKSGRFQSSDRLAVMADKSADFVIPKLVN